MRHRCRTGSRDTRIASTAAPHTGGGGQPVLQGVRITADTVNNTLLIYADQENYRIIKSTLQQVDQPQLQVAIDATIAEVTLNNELSYGVQYYLTSHNLGLRPDQGSSLNTQSTSRRRSCRSVAAAPERPSTRSSTVHFPDSIS